MNAYTGQEQAAGPFGNGSANLTSPWPNVQSLLWLSNNPITSVKRGPDHDIRGVNAGFAKGSFRVEIFNLEGISVSSFEIDQPELSVVDAKSHVGPGVYWMRTQGKTGDHKSPLRKIAIP